MEQNEDTEILAKLGILNSKLESPHKMMMSSSRVESRRVRAALSGTASSLSDDSDSEIIFDRNALLNARKRRRRRRSAARITNLLANETLKWKLFCLACTFLCMGLASVIPGLTKPDIMANAHTKSLIDYSRIFVYAGYGYFVGSVFVSLVFTRVNAFVCFLLLLATSIPFSTLIIYQSQLGNVKFFMFMQGLLFAAIERGSLFLIFGTLKGDKRVLFALYATFALGGALSSILTTEEVFSRATEISQQAHLLNKREISGMGALNITTGELNATTGTPSREEPHAVTRPNSAIGIDEDPNSKTRENTERRKQAANAKKADANGDCSGENTGNQSVNCQTKSERKTTERPPTTTPAPATTPEPTTTTPKTTLAPAARSDATPVNRARNRNPDTDESSSGSSAKHADSLVDQVKEGLADRVHQGLAKVNTASRLAYILIMVATLMTVGLLVVGFCACCIRCTLIADPRISQIAPDTSASHRLPSSTLFLADICWLLQSLPEAILIPFLPHYLLSSTNPTLNTQNSTAFFTCIFWLSVAVFRALVAICPSVAIASGLTKVCYIAGIPACLIFHHMFAESEASLTGGFFVLGFFMNSIPQLTFSWLQHQLDAPYYLLTKHYSVSLSLSKILGPLLAVWTLDGARNRGLMTLLTSLFFLSFAFYVLLARTVNPLARKRQIHELSDDIKGRRPRSQTPTKQRARKGQYEALIEDNNQSDADVEMDFVYAENGDAVGSDSSNSL